MPSEYPAVSTFGWDDILAYVDLPASGETVNSEPFTIPRNSQTFTMHVPTLVASATLKLQALDPAGYQHTASQVWRNVQVFNLAAGGVQPLAAIPGNAATTLPVAATGAGVFRFVASSDQSSTPITVSVTMARLR